LQDFGLVSSSDEKLKSTSLGELSSVFYLKHETINLFNKKINNKVGLDELLRILASAFEYKETPVRHNEEIHNEKLGQACIFKPNPK
jgi:hypothetical protein